MVQSKNRPLSNVEATETMSNEQPVTKRQRIENISAASQQPTALSNNDPDINVSSSSSSSSSSVAVQVNSNGTQIGGIDELDRGGRIDVDFDSPLKATSSRVYLLKPSNDLQIFQDFLMKQCLCSISERTLSRPFQCYYNQDSSGGQRAATLTEWPTNRLIQFLSNMQLLLDVYLKQNQTGHICQRIMDVCNTLIQNGHNIIDEIIDLCDYNNKYVQYLAGKVMTSFLVVAKDQMNNDWLEKLVNNLFMLEDINHDAVRKISFSLEIFKRIIEWKDIELHPLDDTYGDSTGSDSLPVVAPPLENNYFAAPLYNDYRTGSSQASHSNASTSNQPTISRTSSRSQMSATINGHNYNENNEHDVDDNDVDDDDVDNDEDDQQFCTFAPPLKDSESFDTTCLKLDTVKALENKWPALVRNMSILITNYVEINCGESTILTFLSLWESIISVQANLSVVQTMPFHAQLCTFELLLNRNLSTTIYKQMLTLFNEALCYGSTLALQDGVPQEARMLATQIVKHVRNVRDNPPISFPILNTIPQRRPQNTVGLIGYNGSITTYEDDSFRPIVSPNSTEHPMSYVDKTLLQKMVLLVLKSIAVTVKEVRSDSSDSSIDSSDNQAIQDMVKIESFIRDAMEKLENFIKSSLEFHPETHFSKILIYLFDDQDDYLIESMVCTLDVVSILSFRHNPFPELVAMLNPVYTFLEFLRMISNSSDLLLDLLVSNETCFLLYLLRFLKYIRINWSMFVASCQHSGLGNNVLDDAMAVLIRLRLQISRLVSRSLYPYDISPVLRLLESCESLYEGNDLS